MSREDLELEKIYRIIVKQRHNTVTSKSIYDLILSEIRTELLSRVPESDRPYLEYVDICDRELRGIEAFVKEGNYIKIMQIIRSTEKAGIQLGKHQALAEIRQIIEELR